MFNLVNDWRVLTSDMIVEHILLLSERMNDNQCFISSFAFSNFQFDVPLENIMRNFGKIFSLLNSRIFDPYHDGDQYRYLNDEFKEWAKVNIKAFKNLLVQNSKSNK